MKQQTWEELDRESYILAGDCKRCGRSMPVNKYGDCEFCDKVMPLPPEDEVSTPSHRED